MAGPARASPGSPGACRRSCRIRSQQRWKDALGPLHVLWVGVRCDAGVAAGRELARGDRIIGMAASQADLVHHGVAYDLQVDTTHTEALECAQAIAACLR